jgi:hypothetical protein
MRNQVKERDKMSKKLIAVAAAAALGLSALVAVPASALSVVVGAVGDTAAITVSNTLDRASGTGTQADPVEIVVPDAGTVGSADILTLRVSSTLNRTAITASVTNGIKLLDAPGDATNKYTSASGTTALAAAQTTDASGDYTFYAFPTSTTAGVITVTVGTDVTQIYVKGTAGAAYDITSVTIPVIDPKATGTVVATVTDAFGNLLASTAAGTMTLTRVGGTGGVEGEIVYSATSKRYELEITAPDAAGQVAYAAVVTDLTATTAQVTAFGAPQTFFGLVTVTSTADLVKTLQASVTTLTAQVATLTAAYNKLANRWNKLRAAKKAPKKKVALK